MDQRDFTPEIKNSLSRNLIRVLSDSMKSNFISGVKSCRTTLSKSQVTHEHGATHHDDGRELVLTIPPTLRASVDLFEL